MSAAILGTERTSLNGNRAGSVTAQDPRRSLGTGPGISYNTLQKRIRKGKIHPIDGRITGAELRRYLMLDDSPQTRRLMQQKVAAQGAGA